MNFDGWYSEYLQTDQYLYDALCEGKTERAAWIAATATAAARPSEHVCGKCGEAVKISRTAAQNRTYYGWLADMEKTPINEFSGHSSHWWHKEMKCRYLCPIFMRDDPGYAEMVSVLNDIKDIDGYEALRDGVINLTSTTKCSVEQFSEYLTKIERFCHNRGIALRSDSYLYRLALGE